MVTLYKDEELNKMYERDHDIQVIISAYRDVKLSDDRIRDYIMKRFGLTREAAEDYITIQERSGIALDFINYRLILRFFKRLVNYSKRLSELL